MWPQIIVLEGKLRQMLPSSEHINLLRLGENGIL